MTPVQNHLIIVIKCSLLLLIISSCGTNRNSDAQNFIKRDVANYINNNNHKDIIQFISRGNSKDTIIKEGKELTRLLNLFNFYAIDSSQINRYTIEKFSVLNTSTIEGHAKESKLPLQKFSIQKIDNKLNRLTMKIIDKNQLYEMRYQLEMNQKGYLIKANQNVDWAFQDSFRVEGFYKD